MKKLLLSFVVVLMFGSAQASTSLDSNTVTSVVSSKIKEVVDLSVIAGSSAVSFDFDDATKLTNGIVKENAFTLQTKANKAYFVTVQADAANFSGGVAADPLSVATLGVSIDTELTTFTALSATPKAIIGTSSEKITRGVHSYKVNYKMNPGFNAAPAQDYATTLTYTITAQ